MWKIKSNIKQSKYLLKELTEEEIIYGILNIKKCKFPEQFEKLLNYLKNNEFENFIHQQNYFIDDFKILTDFLNFLYFYKNNDLNNCYRYIENFYTEEIYNIYYLIMLMLATKKEMEVKDFVNFEDLYYQKIYRSYKLYLEGNYKDSYRQIAIVSLHDKFKYLIELILLMNMIKLEIYDEAINIVDSFIQLNPSNPLFYFLKAEIFYGQNKIKDAIKIYNKFVVFFKNYQTITLNYLVLLDNMQMFTKWFNFILTKKDIDVYENYIIAKHYHLNGILDKALNYYEKVDEFKFDVNKMVGILFLQLGRLNEAKRYFKREIEIHGEDIDLKKFLRFIELNKRWNK